MPVESEGVHMVARRPGNTEELRAMAPDAWARYTAYGREFIDATWPMDLERIRSIPVAVRDGRFIMVDGWVGPVMVVWLMSEAVLSRVLGAWALVSRKMHDGGDVRVEL